MRIVDLLAILAKKYRERIGQPPNKTKLIKLAYLAEVYYRRITGERLTEQEWIYWKFGPYFFEYEKLLNDSSVFIKPDRRDEFYPVELTEEYELAATTLDTNTALFRAIEHASDDLNDILDFVYFDTEPMINAANRGDVLNFNLVMPQKFYSIRRLYVKKSQGEKIMKKVRKWEKDRNIGSH